MTKSAARRAIAGCDARVFSQTAPTNLKSQRLAMSALTAAPSRAAGAPWSTTFFSYTQPGVIRPLDKIYDGEVVIARTHAVFMRVNLIALNITVANCISYNSVKFCHAFFTFVCATYRYRGTFPLDYMKFRASY
jgi:hypothetical protein